MWLITWFINSSTKSKLFILGLLLFIAAGVYVGFLTHRAKVAERKSREAQEESKRLQQQNEGMKILTNSANIATEVEKEKQLANQQAFNSNISLNRANEIRNANFSNSSLEAANKARCQAYPESKGCN